MNRGLRCMIGLCLCLVALSSIMSSNGSIQQVVGQGNVTGSTNTTNTTLQERNDIGIMNTTEVESDIRPINPDICRNNPDLPSCNDDGPVKPPVRGCDSLGRCPCPDDPTARCPPPRDVESTE